MVYVVYYYYGEGGVEVKSYIYIYKSDLYVSI